MTARRIASLVTLCFACSLLTKLDGLTADGGGEDAEASTAKPFCTTLAGYAICDDFESDGSFIPPWTSVMLHNGTLVRAEIDSGCIVASVMTSDSGAFAALHKLFLTPASRVGFSFDMQVLSYASLPMATINATAISLPISSEGGTTTGNVYLLLAAASTQIVEQHHDPDGGFTAPMGMPFNPPALGKWQHFDVVVDVGAQTVSLAIDGADSGSFSLPPGLYVPGVPIVNAGITSASSSTDQFSIAVDNAVVYLQ